MALSTKRQLEALTGVYRAKMGRIEAVKDRAELSDSYKKSTRSQALAELEAEAPRWVTGIFGAWQPDTGNVGGSFWEERDQAEAQLQAARDAALAARGPVSDLAYAHERIKGVVAGLGSFDAVAKWYDGAASVERAALQDHADLVDGRKWPPLGKGSLLAQLAADRSAALETAEVKAARQELDSLTSTAIAAYNAGEQIAADLPRGSVGQQTIQRTLGGLSVSQRYADVSDWNSSLITAFDRKPPSVIFKQSTVFSSTEPFTTATDQSAEAKAMAAALTGGRG